MKVNPAFFALPLAALAVAPAVADDKADVTAAVATLYERHFVSGMPFDPADIPFSLETRALIDKWAAGIDHGDDEVEDLEDFDWLCECQEWDPATFSYETAIEDEMSADKAHVRVVMNLGWDSEPRELVLTMAKQGGEWKLDDQYSLNFPTGLTGELRKAIAAHENAANLPASEFDRAVLRVFRSYMPGLGDYPFSESDRALPIWSAAMRGRIAEWEEGLDPNGLVDELEDFGWLCECQDWDPGAFKVTLAPHAEPTGNRAEIAISADLGWEEQRPMKLTMVHEGGEWLVDELVSESFPNGLTAAMVEAKANRESWFDEEGNLHEFGN